MLPAKYMQAGHPVYAAQSYGSTMPAAVSEVAPFSGQGEEHERESRLRMRERWGLIGRISSLFSGQNLRFAEN